MGTSRRFVLPLIGLLSLTVFMALYTWSPKSYRIILTAIMIRPTDKPFVDLEYLFTTAECWQKGVDVYLVNPCDSLGRLEGYSPLWLRAPAVFADRPWSVWYGVALAVVFFLSLAALPPARRWQGQVVMGAAAFSSVTIYGVERGNIDLIIFVIALAAGLCAARGPWTRLAGYGVLLGASLLKFYPLVGLILISRERLARFLMLAGISVAAVAAFVLEFREELVKTLRNIPKSSYFGDNIAARQLPGGLGVAMRSLLSGDSGHGIAGAIAESRLFVLVTAALLCCAVVIMICWFVRHQPIRRATLSLSRPIGTLLVLGAVLICGCFFAGQSVAYRAILLLLVLPGLLALGRDPADRRTRKIAGWTVAAILLVMWRLTLIELLATYGLQSWRAEGGGGSALAAVLWIGFELAWWWIVSVLSALLLVFLLDSPTGRRLLALLGRQPAGLANEPF